MAAIRRFCPTFDIGTVRVGELVAIATVTDVVRLRGTPVERLAACCPRAGKWGWLLKDVYEVAPGIVLRRRLGLFRAVILR